MDEQAGFYRSHASREDHLVVFFGILTFGWPVNPPDPLPSHTTPPLSFPFSGEEKILPHLE